MRSTHRPNTAPSSDPHVQSPRPAPRHCKLKYTRLSTRDSSVFVSRDVFELSCNNIGRDYIHSMARALHHVPAHADWGDLHPNPARPAPLPSPNGVGGWVRLRLVLVVRFRGSPPRSRAAARRRRARVRLACCVRRLHPCCASDVLSEHKVEQSRECL